jgi:hypothetical protein
VALLRARNSPERWKTNGDSEKIAYCSLPGSAHQKSPRGMKPVPASILPALAALAQRKNESALSEALRERCMGQLA